MSNWDKLKYIVKFIMLNEGIYSHTLNGYAYYTLGDIEIGISTTKIIFVEEGNIFSECDVDYIKFLGNFMYFDLLTLPAHVAYYIDVEDFLYNNWIKEVKL